MSLRRELVQSQSQQKQINNKYVGPPTVGSKLTRPRVSHAADDAHRLPLHGFAAAVPRNLLLPCALSPGQTDGRTNGQTK